MQFVYLHVIWFASWIGFPVEHYPFGPLTMIVSLEATLLSTFVMISQNRAAAKLHPPQHRDSGGQGIEQALAVVEPALLQAVAADTGG